MNMQITYYVEARCQLEVVAVGVLKEEPKSIVWVGAGSIMCNVFVLTISHVDMMGLDWGMEFEYMQILVGAMARIN